MINEFLLFFSNLRLEMYGRSYQWVIMGAYSNNWWNVTSSQNDIKCTQEELKITLESTILVDLLPLSTTGDITVSGIVSLKINFY